MFIASILAESLDASIYSIEARDRVLLQFSAQTSALVEKALSKKGVNIFTSIQVAEVKEDCIMFTDNTCLDCDMDIWTAGIKPGQFVQDLELPKKNGWILVNSHLNAEKNIYAIGDAAWVEIDAKLATETGLEAERQAKYLAGHFRNMIKGRAFEKYSVRASADSQVALISSGPNCAMGVMGKTCIGVPTLLIYSLKRWIDKLFKKRFK